MKIPILLGGRLRVSIRELRYQTRLRGFSDGLYHWLNFGTPCRACFFHQHGQTLDEHRRVYGKDAA